MARARGHGEDLPTFMCSGSVFGQTCGMFGIFVTDSMNQLGNRS